MENLKTNDTKISEAEEREIDLDILKQVESLSIQLNESMASRTKFISKRYPLTFLFLILAGAVAVSEGLKDILTSIPFFDGHPWRLFLVGFAVLAVTGSLYKKLNK